MGRPRNEAIKNYEQTDKGTIRFPRSEIEAEMTVLVGPSGMCYTAKQFAGRRVNVLVFRP